MDRKQKKLHKQTLVSPPETTSECNTQSVAVEAPHVAASEIHEPNTDPVEAPAPFENTPSVDAAIVPAEKVSVIDKAIDTLAHAHKPWYLTSRDIYQTVKNAATSIPRGKDVFAFSLQGLEVVTQQINAHTKLQVVFDVQDAYDLIEKLDGVLADHLVAVDDGLDELRGKLALQLRALITAVVAHKKWAETVASEASTGAQRTAQTRFEKALELVQSLVESVEERYPAPTKFVRELSESAAGRVQQCREIVSSLAQQTPRGLLISSALYILQSVQPTVHRGVEFAVPFWNQSICVARPVAKPMFDVAKQSALSLESKLSSNSYIGKHVLHAHEVAFSVAEDVARYAIPSSVEIVYL